MRPEKKRAYCRTVVSLPLSTIRNTGELQESVAESTSTKGKNKKSGKHTPYRSSRFEDSPVGSARKGKERHAPGDGGRGQHLDCGGGSGGGSASRSESSCDGDDADGHELLRFPGIRLNVGGQECLACYHAARIMVSFECEVRNRREKDGHTENKSGQAGPRDGGCIGNNSDEALTRGQSRGERTCEKSKM